MTEKLGFVQKLLSDEKLAGIADLVAQLDGPLGVGAVPLPHQDRLRLATGGSAPLLVFDQPFNTRGELSATAEYLGQGAEVDPFGTGERQALHPERNTGRLELTAGLGLDTEVPLIAGAGGGVQLSAKSGASAELRYRHFYAAPTTWKQARAFRELVLGSRLPNLLDLATPPDIGEVHALEAKLSLDFGLDFRAGYETAQDLAIELAGDTAVAFETNFAAALHAALGLGLYERMTLVVGRAGQLQPGWVRVRLQREHERRLSFTTTFSLDLHYDLGTGLIQIFEEAVDRLPTQRLVDEARKIAALADPEALEAKATGALAEVVEDLIGEKIVAALDDVIPFAQEVVTAFDGIDERVRSLWDRILSKADLSAGSAARQWLERLAGLSSGVDLEDLLDGDAKELVEAIEAISGRSLEAIVLDANGLDATLTEVAGVASEALAFLDDTPGDVIAKVQAFAERTGIARAVDVLRTLQSKEQLQQEVSSRIQALAAKVTGKVVDDFLADDLAEVKTWAERAATFLDPNDPSGAAGKLKQRIVDRLGQLEAKYGLSIAFEIERVSRTTALLDLELSNGRDDGAVKLRRQVGEGLRLGSARRVLQVLVDAAGMIDKGSEPAEEDAEPAFLLRECAFASERIRSSAVSIAFKLIGLGKLLGGGERGYTRRIEQTAIRVRDRRLEDPSVGAGGKKRFVRSGRYVAGYQRGEQTPSLSTETAIWLVCEDEGFGLDLEAAYTGKRSRSLRLAFSWDDASGNDTELAALYRLLAQLGFAPAGDGPRDVAALAALGRSVRFAFELRFPQAALEAVFAKLAGSGGAALWRRAFLNASYRYFAETFVSRPPVDGPARNTRNLGQVLATILRSSAEMRAALADGNFMASGLAGKNLTVHFDTGPAVTFPIGRIPGDPQPLTLPLLTINRKAMGGRARLTAIGTAWKGVGSSQRAPGDYGALQRAFSNGWRGASIATLRWPSSMFAVWLWLALLGLAAPDRLRAATGVATLRWRRESAGGDGGRGGGAEAPFSEPMLWRLEEGEGVPDPLVDHQIFPIA